MFYEMTVPQFTKMLHNLTAILDKGALFADSKKFEIDVLLNARLAPDQLPLMRQIQIACDTVKMGVARLTGKEAPTHLDTEKSLPEIKTRIESTLAYLATFSAKDFSESATRQVSQPRWEGQYLNGMEYLQQHMLPNFYFHVTTAYSILRHNGVDIGKKDYLGKMPFKK